MYRFVLTCSSHDLSLEPRLSTLLKITQTMERLISLGRTFFGLALIGVAVQQTFYPGFRSCLTPTPVWLPALPFWVAFSSVLLIVAGTLIIQGRKAKKASLVLGAILLLLFLLGHVPHQLNNNGAMLGAWTDALKGFAFSGGAFVIAGSFTHTENSLQEDSSFIRIVAQLIPAGRIFFSITMIIFGIDHFLYTDFVATLVPSWIPGSLFWTYFAAIALTASGLAIIFKIKTSLIATLLGIMIFLWMILLHIPRAIADPNLNNGNEITGVFQALGFAGIAFVLAGLSKNSAVYKIKKTKEKNRYTGPENIVRENEKIIT